MVTHCLNSYTLLEGEDEEATFSSPGKHKVTIDTESLVCCKLQSNRKPLKRNGEGRDDQPWSRKAASLTNATRASRVTGASIAVKQARQTQPWSQGILEREALGRSGKFMLQISHDESIEINNKTCKFKKNLQVAKSMQQLWHTCHASRAQHLLRSSVGKLTGSARDTIPRQQDKREGQQQQQQIPCYFVSIPKRMLVARSLALMAKVYFFQMVFSTTKILIRWTTSLDSTPNVMLTQTLADVINENTSLFSTINGLY